MSLQLHGVTRHYGRRTVLHDVTAEVLPGERVALQGANGSGKTTLLRIAAGSLRPSAGTTRHQGTLAYLPQESPVYRELTVMEHLQFVSKIHGDSFDKSGSIQGLIDAGLSRLADRPAGTLSRGQRQRLGLLMTFQPNADLLLLDEPWTGLDAAGTHWLSDQLQSTDAAVLASIHEGTPFQPTRTLTLDGGRLQ